jgi:protein-disulfide isomerase
LRLTWLIVGLWAVSPLARTTAQDFREPAFPQGQETTLHSSPLKLSAGITENKVKSPVPTASTHQVSQTTNSLVSSSLPVALNEVEKRLLQGAPPKIGGETPVTIVIFGDFECGFCKRMNDLLDSQLMPQHEGQVSLVYRYLPLPQHPWANEAARMAECVKLQNAGAFWTLSSFLYANQESLSLASLRSRIESFLTTDGSFRKAEFNRCVDSGATTIAVKRDIQMATELGVSATPTLFVNGRQLHGVHELKQLEDAVNAALTETQMNK